MREGACWQEKDRVSGDGHGYREFRSRPLGHRELTPGFRRLMAKRLTPEKLTTVAVTRHLKRIISAGNYPVSGFPLRHESLRAAKASSYPFVL